MKTTNYTGFKNNLKGFLDEVINDCEPLIVKRSGGRNASVVIIPLDEYNAIKETEYLMSSPEMMKRIRSAEKHMNAGIGTKIIEAAKIEAVTEAQIYRNLLESDPEGKQYLNEEETLSFEKRLGI